VELSRSFLGRLAGAALALSALLGAQSPTGSISGVATDPRGAVIPSARISVRSAGVTRATASDVLGRYEAAGLPAGAYQVVAEAPGFAALLQRGIWVATGQKVVVDLPMQVSPAVETVTVTEKEPRRAGMTTVISGSDTVHLPLAERRPESLAPLTPAAGGQGGRVGFRTDGLESNPALVAETNGREQAPYGVSVEAGISIEALQELRVHASNFSSQYGRSAGGITHAVTKSGTNDLHGSFFYLIRDDALNAQNFTAKAQGIPKPQDRWQQFGPAMGGALKRNRLFYFLSYDQQERSFPAVVVPNAAGFLSSSCTAPGCSSAVDFYRSLQGPQDRSAAQRLGLARIDWNPTAGHQFSSTVNVLRWDSPNGIYTAPTHNSHSSANGADAAKTETVTARWTSVAGAGFASELRAGGVRYLDQQTPNAAGPYVAITNGIDFGMPAFLPRAAYPDERRWQIAHNLSWLPGRHSLKFGWDAIWTRDRIAALYQGGGVYTYSALNDFALDCLNPALALGDCRSTPTNGSQGLRGRHYTQFAQAFDMAGQNGASRFSTRDHGFYLEDSFRPATHLMVTLGLRYEIQTMPVPEAPNPALPGTSRINTDWNNLAPRAGLSWSPFGDPKTVIRAGAGVYYARTQSSLLSSLLRDNGQRLESYQFLPGTAGSPAFPQVMTAPPETLLSAPSAVFAAGDFVNPLAYHMQFTVERELFHNFVLSGSYLGARGQRFPLFRDINLFPPGLPFSVVGETRPFPQFYTATYTVCAAPSGGSSAACPRMEQTVATAFFPGPAGNRPNPAFGRMSAAESVVNTWYNGLVLQAQRRFASGFYLQAALTISKTQDNDPIQPAFYAPNQPLNPFQVRDEYSLSNQDQRKRFTMSAHWLPPFHRLGYRPLRAALEGFRLSTVVTLADGRPYSPEISGNSTPMGVSTGMLGVGGSTRAPWLGRNIYTTPGLASADLRVSRRIPIKEQLKLDLIAEAFNLFNRTNVTGVNTTRYHLRSSTLFPDPAFGSASATGNSLTRERQLQFGLRFTF